MSEENVEIVRAGFEAWNAGDRERALSLFDPDIEFRSAIEQKTYRGPDAMVRYIEDVAPVIEDFHFDDIRVLDAGKDRVVAVYRIVGRGAGSGVPVSREVASLWQLRNGKLLKGEIYLDQREALEAAGLSE
jgi:ketosteroid isomerase-like protein